MPLIRVERYKKEKNDPTLLGSLMFEVEYASEHLLPMNYISQFSLNKTDFIVIGRLLTSKFAVIQLGCDPMECQYFGLDSLTTLITSIHCSEDSKTIIAGYQSGSIALWSIVDAAKASKSKGPTASFKISSPYLLELKSLQSSCHIDGTEIVAIDSNVDLGMFCAINKNFCVTIHSLQTGQCLNYIKFNFERRSIHGLQLSKNGYFILATCVSENVEIQGKNGKAELRR